MKHNYVALVQAARRDTINAGIDVNADECSRFAVVTRAASLIAQVEPGIGLLYKPTGNQCQERAVDILCWPDGVIVDVLGAGPDGPCSAIWMENPVRVDPSRWRPPVLPADVPRPVPDAPPPVPQPDPLPVPERAPEPPQTAPAGLPVPVPEPPAIPNGFGALLSAAGAWAGTQLVALLLGWWQKRQAPKAPVPTNPVSGAIPRPTPPTRARLPK